MFYDYVGGDGGQLLGNYVFPVLCVKFDAATAVRFVYII